MKDVLKSHQSGVDNKAGATPEKSKPEAMPSENKPEQVILAQSKEDLFLRQLIGESSKEPDVWYAGQIDVDEKHKSMFRLPDELCEGHKKQAPEAKNYAYVWVEVSDERIARMYMAQAFIPVNRTNHPWLHKSYFSVMGVIERHGYSRHVLFYQPRDYNEKVKEAKGRIADQRRKELNEKVDAMGGAVRLEHIEDSKKGGGYGETPDAPPVVTDWSGNIDNEARAAYNAAD